MKSKGLEFTAIRLKEINDDQELKLIISSDHI
jgi:hypothetical protein